MSFFLSSPVGCYFLKKDDHPVINKEGISIMKTLGENMAWLLKKINS